MKELEIANWLNEGSKSKANTNQVGGRTRTYTGTALADSDHGRVVVDMGGDSVTAEGEQGVEIPCGPQVKKGDRVLITTVNGSPYVSSVDGWGDYIGDQAAYASLYVGELDARHITAQRIDAATAYIGELEAGEITAEKITATTGFFDDLAADNITAQTIIADSATVGDLAADHVTTSQLEAATARIGDLEADHVSTTDLTAVNANISTLQSNKADISYLTSNYIDANTINSTYATITNLNAANGRITNLESSKADITYLESNYIDADAIAAGYAAIDLANVNNAWIDHGVIRDAAISSAQIIGVSANKLTAGTINGSVINVTNLNADNITAGTLNGQRLGQGTIDLDKLSADVYTEDEVDTIVGGLNDRIDAQIETWTTDAVPTLNNYPASSWNTNDLKAEHVGDICYVINDASEANGYTYRFAYDNTNQAYSWILIKDNQVTAALRRLITAEGKIEGLESFESSTSTWITQTDSGIETLRTQTTTLATDFGTFQTETFADLVDEVDEQSSTITTLSETTSTISNTVNSVSQTASENSSKISSLVTTVGANSDGTNPGSSSIISRTSAVEQDLSGFKTTVSNTYYTKTDVNGLITTEVNNRNSAIEQSANNITASVSSTYATKTSVEGVQDDVTALEERMESAEASIEVNAGNISSKVSQTEFRSLRVGGRNLLRSTGDPVVNTAATWPTSETESVGLTDWRSYASVGVSTLEETTDGVKITHGSSTTKDGFVIPLVDDDAVVGGEEYVLSFEYRSNVANFDNAYIITSTKTNNVLVAASTVVVSETDWVKYSRVITWPSTSGKIMRALLPVYFNGDGKWVEIKDGTMKLEHGNKLTDWTPAPEDVSSSISDAEQRMTTMASGIGELATGAAASASSAQASADNAQKSADAAQNSADALDDQINGENGLADKLGEQIEQMGVVSELVSEIDQRADRITAILEETNAITGTVTKWMTFGSDDDDDPALEIGASNSQMKSRFTNKKLQFVHEDHDILLELDGETSTVKAMNIETSGQIQIGKYAWVPNGTGISLFYVG